MTVYIPTNKKTGAKQFAHQTMTSANCWVLLNGGLSEWRVEVASTEQADNPDLRETLTAANYSGPGPGDEQEPPLDCGIGTLAEIEPEASAMNPWGTPERPFAWKLKGHSSDFDDCGTAQATLETEGAKLTIEILAGDYDSVKDAARLIELAPKMADLLNRTLSALEDEEESVKDEHEDILQELREMSGELGATK